jgi:hypothetical protein
MGPSDHECLPASFSVTAFSCFLSVNELSLLRTLNLIRDRPFSISILLVSSANSCATSSFVAFHFIKTILVVLFATTVIYFGRLQVPAMQMPHSDFYEQSTMGTSATDSPPRSNIADFFAPDVFQAVLSDPATATRLRSFCESNACGENIVFLEKVCFKGLIWPSKTPTTSAD